MLRTNHDIRVEIEQKCFKLEAPLKVHLENLDGDLQKFKDLSMGKISDLYETTDEVIQNKFDEQAVQNNETVMKIDKLNMKLKMTDQNLLKTSNTM